MIHWVEDKLYLWQNQFMKNMYYIGMKDTNGMYKSIIELHIETIRKAFGEEVANELLSEDRMKPRPIVISMEFL